MKVSLIMAIYNGEKYLIEQLDSIRNQTCFIDEVLLIDDVSTDSSYEIIRKYIDGYKLSNWKLMKNETNLGYRKNFYKGLSLVTGDIIFLCDQDDRWHLDKIEIMLNHMKNDNVLSLASSFNFMDETGKCFEIEQIRGRSNNNLLYKEVCDILTEVELDNLLEMNFSQGCTMAVKKIIKDKFLEISNNELPHDWELNIIAAVNNGCFYLDKPLIDYRIHNNNTIGMDNIVDNSIINEKRERVNKRIVQTKEQIKNVNFALKLELSNTQKERCFDYKAYLSNRVYMMENKKNFKLLIYYIKGNYKGFGQFKTFIGDLIASMKQVKI